MATATDVEQTHAVRAIFARIAHRYDLLNRLMTLGMDGFWRREAIRRLALAPHAWVLDLGSGTGDIGLAIKRSHRKYHVVACDLTIEMVQIGRKRKGGDRVSWIIADAQHLPFRDETFNGVISGFLLRNVPSVEASLAEQFRVTCGGGRFAALDTTRPKPGIWYPIVWIQLHWVIPFLGKIIGGDAEAYHYLPQTTENFLRAEDLAHRIGSAGFHHVNFARRMFGTIAIHWAKKLP